MLLDSWPHESDWTQVLENYFQTRSFQDLDQFLFQERRTQQIFPPAKETFAAFEITSFQDVKVVILGQDPYHGSGQAHGLSFSVTKGTKHPPSLRNIFRELVDDLGGTVPEHGDLSPWAKQGVFLLNTVLTVRESEANSHRKKGWEDFTDQVIRELDQGREGLVFLLWGKPAEKKASLLKSSGHVVLTSPHPSPLSAHRGFFGSRPFSQANAALEKWGQTPINWSLATNR